MRRGRAPHLNVQRARIVLLAAHGHGSEDIARAVGWSARAVRKWKNRFAQAPSVEVLDDAKRSGRPARVPLAVRCQLVRLACERPAGKPAAFRDVWSYKALGDALEARTQYRLSRSEIGRILRFSELRPHHVQQWLHTEDPEFLPKATALCELYLHPPKGAVVVCVDEKPLQVLQRLHPTHVAADAAVRYEFEYKRRGTQSLLAAFDIKSGNVFARVVPSRSGDALVSFMEQLASRYPGKEIYVVWDNLNIHYDGRAQRWRSFNARHAGRFHFVYTPKHASWMNQVEIWFSILHRRVIKHGDFTNAAQQRSRIEGFADHWNRCEAHPFRWTWRADAAQNRRAAA